MKTISDLVERFQLYAVCTDCERMERVLIEDMLSHHGPDLTIDSLRRRLRCGQCRRRTGDIRIVYVGERAKLSGFHYRGNSLPPVTQPVTQPAMTAGDPITDQPVSSSVDSSVRPKPSTPT